MKITINKINDIIHNYLRYAFSGKIGRLECYGILRTVTASFAELQSHLLSQLPKPNDSNHYRNRLIYFSCNNYLTFHVFKTSFIMPQSLHITNKWRRASWLVLLAYINTWGNSCFVFLSNCSEHAFVLPTTTSFIMIFIKIFNFA